MFIDKSKCVSRKVLKMTKYNLVNYSCSQPVVLGRKLFIFNCKYISKLAEYYAFLIYCSAFLDKTREKCYSFWYISRGKVNLFNLIHVR